jgi:hypothetical protein
MLYDRSDDKEFGRSLKAVRAQLSRANERVKAIYPNARIRWMLKTCCWIVVDPVTRETFEASSSLDELATGGPVTTGHPHSGTHRHTDDDEP